MQSPWLRSFKTFNEEDSGHPRRLKDVPGKAVVGVAGQISEVAKGSTGGQWCGNFLSLGVPGYKKRRKWQGAA